MIRIRLALPLHFFLSAESPGLLNPPPLNFEDATFKVRLWLDKGEPLQLSESKKYFRTIHRCRVELRSDDRTAQISRSIESQNFESIVNFLTPVVNRIVRAIRNFGWVTTAREYKVQDQPEALLRLWGASARIRGKWRDVAPEPPKKSSLFDALFALENVETGSLDVSRWTDIEQAIVEGLAPNPENEFLTNALQHLHENSLRLALIEATVSLEIVLSQCLEAYLRVRQHFSKERINSVLNNVGLTSRVGLVLQLIFTSDERKEAKLDSVLRAINWRKWNHS